MRDSESGSVYASVASFAVRRPWLVMALFGVLTLICAAIIPSVKITTNRFGLVSSENPHQARMERFFDRFGYPDMPVVLVRGADPNTRRDVVDALASALDAEPLLHDRVLAKVGPSAVAEVLLVRDPKALLKLRERLPPDADVPAILEAGLPGLLDALKAQLEASLDGEGPARSDAEVDDGLARLGTLAALLDAQLAGRDTRALTSELLDDENLTKRRGVDEYGYFIGWKANHHLIALFPEFPSGEVDEVRPYVEAIRAVIARVGEAEGLDAKGIEVMVTGLPVFSTDEIQLVREGLLISSLVTGISIFLLQLLAFRSLRNAIFVQLPLAVGILTTVGFVGVVYGRLTIITASFIAILLGLGIDFSIHLVARANEIRRERSCGPGEAIIEGIRRAGPGVAAGALTTMIAFITVTTTEFTAFAELGVITAFGMVAMMIAAFVLLPALLGRGWGGHNYREARIPGLAAISRGVRAAPWIVIAIAVGLTVWGGFAFPRISFNARYFDFLPEESPAAIALNALEDDGAMSPTFGCVSAESLTAAREKAEALRALPKVADVQSVTDLFEPLGEQGIADLRAGFDGITRDPDLSRLANRKRSAAAVADSVKGVIDILDEIRFELNRNEKSVVTIDKTRESFVQLEKTLRGLPDDGVASLAEIEEPLARILERAWSTARAVAKRGQLAAEDVPEIFQARFVARDGTGAVAIFAFPVDNIWDLDAARAFTAELQTVDPEATGFAVTLHEHTAMIISGFRRAAIASFLLIFVYVVWIFRRLGDALLAMLPVACGWCWMIAMMELTGIAFNVVNIVILPLVIGIGMDAGIHVVHRYRQSAAVNDGVAALYDLLEGTGAAVILSSITTIIAFGGLTLADYGGMKTLGYGMMLGVGSCLLASVLVLPAVLVVLRRAR
ncbi:MAG: MMPL family transporter [Nannocystaceae bacterium]